MRLDEMLADSPFTSSFLTAFRSGMSTGYPRLQMGIGAAEHLALDFYLSIRLQHLEEFDESRRGININ